MEKENLGDKTSTGEDKNKNTSKANKLETRHLKLHLETLVDKNIEPELKEEEQGENQQQLKEYDTENTQSHTCEEGGAHLRISF